MSTGGGPAVFFKEAVDVVITVKANIGGRLFDLDTIELREDGIASNIDMNTSGSKVRAVMARSLT